MASHNHTTLTRALAIAIAVCATSAMTTGSVAGAASSGGVAPGGGADAQESGDSGSGDKYALLWERTSRKDRRWARKTAECESGRDPDAIGGGGMYRGAFQFMKSTWKSAPKSPGGDPIDYNYKTQAVVAVALKNKDGAHHWPVCG
jgi:soluble lytic murein transglycosylase-like protein